MAEADSTLQPHEQLNAAHLTYSSNIDYHSEGTLAVQRARAMIDLAFLCGINGGAHTPEEDTLTFVLDGVFRELSYALKNLKEIDLSGKTEGAHNHG